jgi:hypothetical protein
VKGWDALREERWQRMRKLGIGGAELSAIERDVGPPYPFPEAIKQLGPNEVNRPVAWDTLTPAQRDFQATKMADPWRGTRSRPPNAISRRRRWRFTPRWSIGWTAKSAASSPN